MENDACAFIWGVSTLVVSTIYLSLDVKPSREQQWKASQVKPIYYSVKPIYSTHQSLLIFMMGVLFFLQWIGMKCNFTVAAYSVPFWCKNVAKIKPQGFWVWKEAVTLEKYMHLPCDVVKHWQMSGHKNQYDHTLFNTKLLVCKVVRMSDNSVEIMPTV